jgi:hypothetical protein
VQKINPLELEVERGWSRGALAREVARRVYRRRGLRGYYAGYCASLAAYVPNSALWWALYQAYQGVPIKLAAAPGIARADWNDIQCRLVAANDCKCKLQAVVSTHHLRSITVASGT